LPGTEAPWQVQDDIRNAIMDADTGDVRWMTYAELGRARGISTASATRLAFRRKWRRQGGNDGIARVAVPVGEDQSKRDDRDDDRSDVTALELAVSSLTDARQQAEKRAEAAEIRADAANKRADIAAALADRLLVQVTEAEKRADQAQAEAQEARQTLEGFRRAGPETRRGQGRWARLRTAWRGE
jgi:hypothetical protein